MSEKELCKTNEQDHVLLQTGEMQAWEVLVSKRVYFYNTEYKLCYCMNYIYLYAFLYKAMGLTPLLLLLWASLMLVFADAIASVHLVFSADLHLSWLCREKCTKELLVVFWQLLVDWIHPKELFLNRSTSSFALLTFPFHSLWWEWWTRREVEAFKNFY